MVAFGTYQLGFISCSIFAFILLFVAKHYNNISTFVHVVSTTESSLHVKPSEETSCSWQFHSYTPSAWETYWFSNIEKLQYRVCPTLARVDQRKKVVDALMRIISLQESTFNEGSPSKLIDSHFSKMHYRRKCLKEEYNAIQLIEPLIGLLRDPLSMCPRNPAIPSKLYLDGDFATQSKRFFLLAPSSPFQINRPVLSNIAPLAPWLYRPSSQKILIDIGSAYFGNRNGNAAELGTKWFYDYFKNKSIQFDRIIAYEDQQLDTRRVWEDQPDDVFTNYTFINVGVETTSGKFNPWKMLESVAQPDDYVVVKLDVDNPTLENALISQLLDKNNTTRNLIDELFFERHISTDPNSKDDKLQDSYELFTKFRQLGVRMHGWP